MPTSFWYLLAGSFFNRVGTFIVPFLTLYLTTERGMSISQATLIVSLSGIGSMAAGLSGGVLSDIIGRRKTMLASLLLSAIFMLTLGSVKEIGLLALIAIILGYCTDLYRPAASAVITDLVSSEQRVHAFGLRYWANNVGAAMGPLIAGVVAKSSFLLLFVGDALSTLLFSLMIWLGVPETKPQVKEETTQHIKKESGWFLHVMRDTWLWAYTLLSIIFTCIYLQYNVTLPLSMRMDGLDQTQYGIVMSINGLLVVLLSIPLNLILSRFPMHLLLALAALLMGAGYGLNGFFHGFYGYLIATGIWTLGEMINQPLASALISRISPIHLRGTYQGVYGLGRGLSGFIAPLLGGFLLEHFGTNILWTTCLISGITVAGTYVLLHILSKPRKPSH